MNTQRTFSFSYNFRKYFLILLNFGILLGVERYFAYSSILKSIRIPNEIRIQQKRIYNILYPFLIVTVVLIRSYIPFEYTDHVFFGAALLIISTVFIADYLQDRGYIGVSYLLYTIGIKALYIPLFFLYIGDYMQQYTNDLPGEMVINMQISMSLATMFTSASILWLYQKLVYYNVSVIPALLTAFLTLNMVIRYSVQKTDFKPDKAKLNIGNLINPLLIFDIWTFRKSLTTTAIVILAAISIGQLRVYEEGLHVYLKQISTRAEEIDTKGLLRDPSQYDAPLTDKIAEGFINEIFYSAVLLVPAFIICIGPLSCKLLVYMATPLAPLAAHLFYIALPFRIEMYNQLATIFKSVDKAIKKPSKDAGYLAHNYESKQYLRTHSELVEPIISLAVEEILFRTGMRYYNIISISFLTIWTACAILIVKEVYKKRKNAANIELEDIFA